MTTLSPINAEKIKENEWKQGDIFPQEAIKQIAEKHFPDVELDGLRIIVVSHSCDIRYYKADEELWIEILLARSIQNRDNASIQGRRQRYYHLEIENKTSGIKSWFEANIDDRYRIYRNFCADYKPSSQWVINNDEKRSIARWIAYRYTRIALPDAFNERIRPKKNELKKLLKKDVSQFISGLYICLSNQELQKNQTYEIEIIGAITKQHYSNPDNREVAGNHILEFEKIVSNCDGINVTSKCLSEENISLDDIKRFTRFTDYDYLSYDTEADVSIIL
ncbi:MAG: hypothetical protein LBE12_15035 [Planctomycetaceae bacterium]|jgi:hypothetical protein|nr:hypothetical protein [Planctomycetaceae bacterium]